MKTALHWRSMLKQYVQHIERFNFELVAWEMFQYQSRFNPIYKAYLDFLKIRPQDIISTHQIPFLPISLFKDHEIVTDTWPSEAIYTSSGTTGQVTSKHFVREKDWYLENCVSGFEQHYGPIKDLCVLALLPSYLEREGSSLIDMAEHFIGISEHEKSGFFLHNHDELAEILKENTLQNTPTLLLGVTFALLNFVDNQQLTLGENTIVMETGGMKGRRKEMTREAVHEILTKGFGVANIHSEYGMTELLSQGYSKGKGIFEITNTMRVYLREINDPFSFHREFRNGCLNIIDLANIDSCAFLATDDLGTIHADGTFEVKGRIDHADIRGCNLMV